MRYTVIWVPNAEAKLASIWTAAYAKAAIAEAANEIDRVLRTEPKRGIITGDNYRIGVGPSEAKSAVRAADCLVRVLDVRLLPPGNGSI
jgi:plasmid stabilization system protein ParE